MGVMSSNNFDVSNARRQQKKRRRKLENGYFSFECRNSQSSVYQKKKILRTLCTVHTNKIPTNIEQT